MKKRILTALLAFAVVISLIPVQTVFAMSPSELEEQVSNTYRMACHEADRTSFDGYCAYLVNLQLVILGINSSYVSGHGKDEFDNYKNRQQSNGGYYITAYPAADYSLAAALNAITNNGETDAYNILVGFEKSTSSLGSRYGHVVFLHGIVDGIAYFCESFDNTIGETTYPEGSVIACSIDTFTEYYNSWATLDGVIHFEAELCDHTYAGMGVCSKCGKAYPLLLNKASMGKYKVLQEFSPFEAPYSEAGADSGTVLSVDAEVEVAGSMTNAYGESWYQLTYGSGKTGYIPIEYLSFASASYEEQEITCNLTSPAEGALVPRSAYPVKGKITSKYPLRKVQAYIDGQLYTTVSLGSQTTLNIQTSTINHSLSFSTLAPGAHTLTIQACDIYREEMAVICERSFITEGEIVCQHVYESALTEPTCTAGGYTTYTCACGDTYTADEVAPLGHSGTYSVAAAPTATAEGTVLAVCDRCAETVTQTLPALNCSDYTLELLTAPTDDDDGLARYTWNVTEFGIFSFEAALPNLLLGDVNEDGSVTILDLMRLANHFAKNAAVSEANSDVNADGSITILDLMRLANFFAGKAELG